MVSTGRVKELTIRAVFLDYGNTLAYGEPDVWKVFQEVCSRHGVDLTRQDIDRGRAMADQTHLSVMFQTEESMEFFWVEWLRLILHHLEVENGLEMARETRSIIRRDQRTYLYDEVREVLDELTSRELCLGVVSNFNCLLEPILIELRVTDYFEFILASDLIRSGKPNRLIFDLAVEFAGVPRKECVHVGDSYGADYQGARGAGLQAILLDRSGRDPNRCPKIRDLREIYDYL
jgi:putative hydrolase of the HAD superfamily